MLLADIQISNLKSIQGPRGGDIQLFNPFPLYYFSLILCKILQNGILTPIKIFIKMNLFLIDFFYFREMTLGGYIQTITTFVPVDESFKPFPVLVFVATAQSKHWLGPACASSIAKQVNIYLSITQC